MDRHRRGTQRDGHGVEPHRLDRGHGVLLRASALAGIAVSDWSSGGSATTGAAQRIVQVPGAAADLSATASGYIADRPVIDGTGRRGDRLRGRVVEHRQRRLAGGHPTHSGTKTEYSNTRLAAGSAVNDGGSSEWSGIRRVRRDLLDLCRQLGPTSTAAQCGRHSASSQAATETGPSRCSRSGTGTCCSGSGRRVLQRKRRGLHERRASVVASTVGERPGLAAMSVSDARVEEAARAAVACAITLSRTTTAYVTSGRGCGKRRRPGRSRTPT